METQFFFLAVPAPIDLPPKECVASLFVGEKEEYLFSFLNNQKLYFGKKMEGVVSFDNLQLTGQHLLSLISILYPGKLFNFDDLILITNVATEQVKKL